MPKGGIVVFDEINVKDFPGETAAFYDSLNATALLYVAFRFVVASPILLLRKTALSTELGHPRKWGSSDCKYFWMKTFCLSKN